MTSTRSAISRRELLVTLGVAALVMVCAKLLVGWDVGLFAMLP
jgi:hypothetical protein